MLQRQSRWGEIPNIQFNFSVSTLLKEIKTHFTDTEERSYEGCGSGLENANGSPQKRTITGFSTDAKTNKKYHSSADNSLNYMW